MVLLLPLDGAAKALVLQEIFLVKIENISDLTDHTAVGKLSIRRRQWNLWKKHWTNPRWSEERVASTYVFWVWMGEKKPIYTISVRCFFLFIYQRKRSCSGEIRTMSNGNFATVFLVRLKRCERPFIYCLFSHDCACDRSSWSNCRIENEFETNENRAIGSWQWIVIGSSLVDKE